jgi:hypothetical protein
MHSCHLRQSQNVCRAFTEYTWYRLNSRKRLRALLAPPGLSKWAGVLLTQTEAVFEIPFETGTPYPSECQETAQHENEEAQIKTIREESIHLTNEPVLWYRLLAV